MMYWMLSHLIWKIIIWLKKRFNLTHTQRKWILMRLLAKHSLMYSGIWNIFLNRKRISNSNWFIGNAFHWDFSQKFYSNSIFQSSFSISPFGLSRSLPLPLLIQTNLNPNPKCLYVNVNREQNIMRNVVILRQRRETFELSWSEREFHWIYFIYKMLFKVK